MTTTLPPKTTLADPDDAGGSEPARPLEATFTKNGYTYELVQREGPFAIYKQRLRPGVGCLAFEVFRVKVAPAGEAFGKSFPRREISPPNEAFGHSAWSYPTLASAKTKLAELLARRDA